MASETYDVLIRPMRADDVAALERLSAESYHEVDRLTLPPTVPSPASRSAAAGLGWQVRTSHLLSTDPGGCWVADRGGEPVGFAVSYVRELMWLLGSYAVRPGMQGQGIGRALLARALEHGRGCLRGMLAASADPHAARRYRSAGFDLHPQMFLHGRVDRAVLPVVRHVREGDSSDRDLLDSVDRGTRGAAHLSDHDVLGSLFRLVVRDRASGSGYAYVDASGAPVLVAATQRRTAADLMWEALAASDPDAPVAVHHVTAANQWALDVGLRAGLAVHQSGYLALRHLKPPAPYLHHGSLL